MRGRFALERRGVREGGEVGVEDSVVIAPQGPIMVGSRRELERRAEEEGAGAGRVVIDLTGAEHIDSEGIATLIGLAARMRKEGRELVLAAPGKGMRRLFELTGLDARIPVRATVAAALGGEGEEEAGGDEPP